MNKILAATKNYVVKVWELYWNFIQENVLSFRKYVTKYLGKSVTDVQFSNGQAIF